MPLLLRKLKFSPVVAIQGARQTGKSFLVRDLLSQELPSVKYVLLDKLSQRDFAQTNPSAFLARYDDARPFAIDEAQKAAALFDEIKSLVDADRRPGRYLLLGSTEFSKMTKVRESLTGRMSRIRLYPFTLAEALNLKALPVLPKNYAHKKIRITRNQLMKHLMWGGFPALFSVRNDSERHSQIQDWLELTTKRDVHQFDGVRVDGDLCFRILEKLALLDEPTAGALAKTLRQDIRRIKTHLNVLKTLFVIQELSPHPLGGGKAMYFLCDVGLATHFGADFARQLYTWTLQELSCQFANSDWYAERLYFYRSPRGGIVHFLIESGRELTAVKLVDQEGFDKREFEILKALRSKCGTQSLQTIVLGADRHTLKKEQIEIFPWETVG